MRVKANREALAAGLATAARAAEARATQSAVGGVLVQTHGDETLVLTGTDGDITVRVALSVDVVEPGMFLAPARRFADTARVLTGETIEMFQSEKLRIESGMFRGSMSLLPTGNFPALGKPEGESFALSGEFGKVAQQVLVACSKDEDRPALAGVCFDVGDGRAFIAATDSVRIARKVIDASAVFEPNLRFTVPRRAVEEIARAVGTSEVGVVLGNERVTFAVPGLAVTAPLITDKFPEYKALVPTQFAATLQVDREEFLLALRRVSLMAENFAPVLLVMRGGEVDLKTTSPEVGDAFDVVEAAYAGPGEGMTIAFNPQYLAEGLEAIAGPKATISLNDPLRPALLTGDDLDYIYILMPTRVAIPEGAIVGG